MSDQPNWKKPVVIEPEQLLSPESPPTTGQPARELPLESVYPVDEPVVPTPPSGLQDASKKPRAGAGRRQRLRCLFIVSIALLLILVVTAELHRLLDWSFGLHWLAGTLVSTLIAVAAGVAGWWIWSSLSGLRQLSNAAGFRTQGLALLDERGQGKAAPYLKQVQQHYRNTVVAAPLQDCIKELDTAYNDGEIVRFVSEKALAEQDEQAYQRVTRYSIESAVLVGVSPYATFDMLLVGWRNLRMLGEVASIYGVAPGMPAQIRLIKQVLGNIAFAGLSEMSVDAGSSLLGSSLSTSLSARFGQGLGAGLITARIGLQAMQLCRPLPQLPSKRPRLQQIQQRLVEEFKKLATQPTQTGGDSGKRAE